MDFIWVLSGVTVLSAGICMFLVRTAKHHADWTADVPELEPQKVHEESVPRVGGVAILLAASFGVLGLSLGNKEECLDSLLVIAVCLPAFLVGLFEDVVRHTSKRLRYGVTGLSALLFVLMKSTTVTSVSIFWLDALLAFQFLSVLFTAFAVASVSHSFNLIDGQNGLCGGVTVLICAGLAWVAIQEQQLAVGGLALLLAVANIGFLILNYPHGRIFLGDCGAYFNGILLGALVVLLVERSVGAVSPWFALALLAYPIWETAFTMFRRIAQRRSFVEADAEHLHSLWHQNDRREQISPLHMKTSAPRLWGLCLMPVLIASVGYASTAVMVATFLGFIVAYQIGYLRERARLAAAETSVEQ